MKIQKPIWKDRPVNLNDLRKAFYNIVYCSTNLNKPNFLDPNWIDTFENLYDIKLTRKELPLVQKCFEEWLAEPE